MFIFVLNEPLTGDPKKLNRMKDTITAAPLTLTEGAMTALKAIRDENKVTENHGLRVGVKGGGCSGFSYILGFDVKKESDTEFMIDDMRVFMNKAHGIYLAGIEIDYSNGLNNRGFIFNNPNAKDTCGCGTSFSA